MVKTSNQRDTFLIGHARRMRTCRKRQRQQDPLAYALRVRIQQQTYRLQQQSKLLSGNYPTKQLKSLLNLRKRNTERQRRYRLNQAHAKKILRKEKDKENKRLTREQKKLNHDNNTIISGSSTHAS